MIKTIPPTLKPSSLSIDVQNPPDEILGDLGTYETFRSLADDPYLDLDGDRGHFGSNEWETALVYLNSYPESSQPTIRSLGRFLGAEAPPSEPALDLGAMPDELRQGMAKTTLLQLLWSPELEANSTPGFLSASKIAAAEAQPALFEGMGDGLKTVRQFFDFNVQPRMGAEVFTKVLGERPLDLGALFKDSDVAAAAEALNVTPEMLEPAGNGSEGAPALFERLLALQHDGTELLMRDPVGAPTAMGTLVLAIEKASRVPHPE